MGEWRTTTDARGFLEACGAFLYSRPVEHTVLLTVSDRLLRGGAGRAQEGALLGWWADADGSVAGAFVHTPPHKLMLAAPVEAAAALGRRLRAAGRRLEGVNAEQAVAAVFAQSFAASTTVDQRHRLHRLAALVPPEPPPAGGPRAATAADHVLLENWVRAFGHEARISVPDVAAAVEDRLAHGGYTLWDAGGPVAVASSNREIAGAVRIGPVYTPPHARRRGYGASVTAAAAAAALSAGAREVLLFTDLANPTSNALYRRLGFQPLEDRVLLAFQD